MGEGNSFTLGGARVPGRVAKIHGAPCWGRGVLESALCRAELHWRVGVAAGHDLMGLFCLYCLCPSAGAGVWGDMGVRSELSSGCWQGQDSFSGVRSVCPFLWGQSPGFSGPAGG